jgi:divalent metal cation (Fe/Co/Zn/Cd) transporter
MSKIDTNYKTAFYLSLFTIFYNLIEGIVSTIFGFKDETLALSGFGIDSFIEVLSGAGIAMMILRISKNHESSISKHEINALKITGTSFYLLSLGLLTGIVLNLIYHHKPVSTFWGVIISIISIVTMYWLMSAKKKVGIQLNSEPIVADSNCTRVCLYMSLVLLASSLIYELTGFAYADVIGTAGLIYFSVTEGREAFEKAEGKSCTCNDH